MEKKSKVIFKIIFISLFITKIAMANHIAVAIIKGSETRYFVVRPIKRLGEPDIKSVPANITDYYQLIGGKYVWSDKKNARKNVITGRSRL
jgi:hypothetical protein